MFQASVTDQRWKPHAVLQSVTAFLCSFTAYHFLFCGDRGGAEYMTFSIIQKYAYEVEKRFRLLSKGRLSGCYKKEKVLGKIYFYSGA